MSIKYGRIDTAESSFDEQTFNKGTTLNSASVGTHHYFGLKDHYLPNSYEGDGRGILSESGSQWAFVHTMFYMSGSQKVLETMPADKEKFNSVYHQFNQTTDLRPFHTNKFYDTASIFWIPQAYFGNRIQPGSFQINGRTGSAANTTDEIIIKDDKQGNLYGYNARHSQSSDGFNINISDDLDAQSLHRAHLTSSKNYIGNIFYDLGVAVLTETASWSGSVTYMDIGHRWADQGVSNGRDYRFWTTSFNSMTPIWTRQYSIKIPAGEFNTTMNPSIKPWGNIEDTPSGSNMIEVSKIKNDLTGSGWSPYVNQIQLFQHDNGEEPLIIANFPRPIQVRDDIDLIITFRLDS